MIGQPEIEVEVFIFLVGFGDERLIVNDQFFVCDFCRAVYGDGAIGVDFDHQRLAFGQMMRACALTVINGEKSASAKITFENCTQSGNTLNTADGQVGGGIYAWWNASTNEFDAVAGFENYN